VQVRFTFLLAAEQTDSTI